MSIDKPGQPEELPSRDFYGQFKSQEAQSGNYRIVWWCKPENPHNHETVPGHYIRAVDKEGHIDDEIHILPSNLDLAQETFEKMVAKY